MISLRAPRASEWPDIHNVVHAAFGQQDEAKLVDMLRERQQAQLETVAEDGGLIVGHIVASAITLTPDPGLSCLGIAPLSVLPGRQSEGIGGMLMRHLIEAARAESADALFLLGHPDYYPRFGFKQTHVENNYGATDAFMALELEAGCLRHIQATAHYVSTFADSGN